MIMINVTNIYRWSLWFDDVFWRGKPILSSYTSEYFSSSVFGFLTIIPLFILQPSLFWQQLIHRMSQILIKMEKGYFSCVYACLELNHFAKLWVKFNSLSLSISSKMMLRLALPCFKVKLYLDFLKRFPSNFHQS